MNRTLFTTHSNAIKYLEWILFLIPRAIVVRYPSGVHFIFYSWDVLCYETLKEKICVRGTAWVMEVTSGH